MKAKNLYAVGVLSLFASCHLVAQESAAQRHEMATNQLKRIAAEMSANCLNDIRTLDDWKKTKPELRRQLLEMLGLDPLPKRTPLKAKITGRLQRDTYHIEKIVFQSLPGLYVTGNLYRSEEHTSELQSLRHLVCRLLLEKKKNNKR